jgi:hypothetical protein
MSPIKPAYAEEQLRRWMRPDAHRFLRPDWRRFWGSGREGDPLYKFYENAERKYRPDQLRDDHGRFADEGGTHELRTPNSIRLASSDKPTFGRHAVAAIIMEVAKRAIEAYRSGNGLRDLFGRIDGTVSYTQLNGKDIFGSNSTSPTYDAVDRAAADATRDAFQKDYPETFDRENIGRMPNNALYHAETTVLLRAARENGGTLTGKTLEVYVDNPMCNNCDVVLPYVGLRVGNPTVTFIDSNKAVNTMRDGRWISRTRP